ncbi:glutathione synthase [Tilletiaria anomala UBC 951]|uniref:Glutathione synthetase n=1 Tax=Tilletiaria anomala (strain ATCC 24038 / CBS 436.72 / UBC 951) TaxID=1037660 RepID=A0A066WCG8_TILAU|nr:glutathione synthase [Tilletiaria anomala UBC 951]KDN51431.1 glutathione synthase [Tilletiaria anomala UBC 951]
MSDELAASISNQCLPAWPPAGLTRAQISHLCNSATDYAFAHGLVYRPLIPASEKVVNTTSVIHAPFSLLPSPFPARLFAYAKSLQPILNELYARVALDHQFLEDVYVKQNVIHVDDFQAKLWDVYQNVMKEGLAQPRQLGLFRSDYLLHDTSLLSGDFSSASSTTDQSHDLTIKQVEFNTISSSFGPLCYLVSKLHQHLAHATGSYFGHIQSRKGKAKEDNFDSLPKNDALKTLAQGLADAHQAYNSEMPGTHTFTDPVILFVIQPNERNAFDQRAIEYELLNAHGIRCVRKTLAELASTVKEHAASLRLPKRELFISAPWSSQNDSDPDQLEVSVVYFRAGYTPTDYEGLGNEKAWDVRQLLERSAAIKCPSVALQLAGAKKVQQVLSEEGILERFLLQPSGSGTQKWKPEDVEALRASWTELYPLDPRSELGKKGYDLAMRDPHRFVLKPQREGGGNNIYKQDIPSALKAMIDRDAKRGESYAVPEREGYILMSLIQPPNGLGNLLMKAGAGADASAALAPDVVSELGIYGTCLFAQGKQADTIEVLKSRSGGHLLRTKGRESDEGGVAVGFSVIDSPYLV